MQTGTVQVHVYTSRANLPLEGATVVITQRDEQGRDILLSNQKTDESGNTAPITIAAPPRRSVQCTWAPVRCLTPVMMAVRT